MCFKVWQTECLEAISICKIRKRLEVSKISPTAGVWDPDPHGLILVGLIRRIQEGKNDPKKYKKEEISSFEVQNVLFWGFNSSPVVWMSVMGGLGISKLQFLIQLWIF